MYIEKTIALEWVSAKISVPEMYIKDIRRNTLTIRLNPYLNLASYNSNIENPLNPWTVDFQFSYDIALIDTTNWDVAWLLAYIVANEPDFTWWLIK